MPQPAKRIAPVKWTRVALVSFILVMALPYLEGRFNDMWPIPLMLPSSLLPLLALIVSSVALFRCWLAALKENRAAIPVCGMFVLSALLLGTAVRSRPADRYHLGFTNYARSVLTLDEWRLLSRVAQEQLGPEGRMPGPDKNLWDEREHRPRWVALCAATQIKKLSPGLMIFVRPGTTELAWGGALVGHRGVVVYTRQSAERQRQGSPDTKFIAEDIATFVSSH